MPVKSDDPLRRVTLNLYEADCKLLEKRYGHGWTTHIREIIHNQIIIHVHKTSTSRRTLGDLPE